MFHHEREIRRERFVDFNPAVLGLPCSRARAIGLCGIIANFSANVLRDREFIFVQRISIIFAVSSSLRPTNSKTFIGSCSATMFGSLFNSEQANVVPDLGVPVISTLRMRARC
ncbi:MAG: hypothetical protein DME57_06690 [Verrucomicrobia bacterium]|nr:MAG: hypothetical protein DME57_06690 [Verrucomicrobiota bacterium]